MKNWQLLAPLLLVLISCGQQQGLAGPEQTDNIDTSVARVHSLLRTREVCNYYENAGSGLVWLDEQGCLRENGRKLVSCLNRSYLEGLDPAGYRVGEINRILADSSPPFSEKTSCMRLDILLTGAYLDYAYDHYAGRIASCEENNGWAARTKEISPLDSLPLLAAGLDFESLINRFRCPYREYRLLEGALQQLYTDSLLPDSLRSAQCLQVALNMERWRWMPRNPVPGTCVIVNCAAFRLKVKAGQEDILEMRIIAGTEQRPTPVFQAEMDYIVLNPWWDVPNSIATRELLPVLQQDPGFLERNHFRLYSRHNPAREVDAMEINWQALTARNFNYLIRQTPGPWNALGEIKFIFPNPYSIYLHDTPNKGLFAAQVRTFSHGCIRVEQPLALAACLLQQDSSALRTMIRNGTEQHLWLPKPVPVFISYLSAYWEQGQLCLEPDVYGYDAQLKARFNTDN